jgi:hypothetical protein
MALSETDNLYTLIPEFVSRLLLIGENHGFLDQRLQAGIQEVWAAAHFQLAPDQVKENYFDCILLSHSGDLKKDMGPILSAAHSLLNENGMVSILFSRSCDNGFSKNKLDDLLIEHGFLRYHLIIGADVPETASAEALVAVRHTYNPVKHARQLAKQGLFSSAINILEGIPHALIGNMDGLSHIAAEKQLIYLKWQQSLPDEVPRNQFLFRCQRELAQITLTFPEHPPAYWCYSDFWRHIGNNRMAARTLRSLYHVDDNPETEIRLLDIPSDSSGVEVEHSPPVWSATRPPPRLLILTHDHCDYGMDTLYDGLCAILGPENVVEYPWKPTLHGQGMEKANNYPCFFNYKSRPRSMEDIISELKQNRFDMIIFADVVQMTHAEEVKRFMEAGKNLPVILYDTWDNSHTPLQTIFEYLGRTAVDLFFKREMLEGLDYGPRSYPLPFGYPGSRIPSDAEDTDRDVDIFWAGKRLWGLRPIYIPRMEKFLKRKFDQTYTQEEYSKRIRSARMGLSFFGSGFDTVRYWELPAHGAMLLTERPPIRIPNNFKDGETAVFFDDLPELEEKLNYYRSHPADVARIAKAGHQHFISHYTTACRAGQFLGYLEKNFSW